MYMYATKMLECFRCLSLTISHVLMTDTKKVHFSAFIKMHYNILRNGMVAQLCMVMMRCIFFFFFLESKTAKE